MELSTRKRAAGGGRKTLPDDMKTFPTSIRLTGEQNTKFISLGGAAWLRKTLDAMRIATPSEVKR